MRVHGAFLRACMRAHVAFLPRAANSERRITDVCIITDVCHYYHGCVCVIIPVVCVIIDVVRVITDVCR